MDRKDEAGCLLWLDHTGGDAPGWFIDHTLPEFLLIQSHLGWTGFRGIEFNISATKPQNRESGSEFISKSTLRTANLLPFRPVPTSSMTVAKRPGNGAAGSPFPNQGDMMIGTAAFGERRDCLEGRQRAGGGLSPLSQIFRVLPEMLA
jgi:hypothetical protein